MSDARRNARPHEDRETPTVEAAAAFERHRGDRPTTRIGGTRYGADDLPGPDEL